MAKSVSDAKADTMHGGLIVSAVSLRDDITNHVRYVLSRMTVIAPAIALGLIVSTVSLRYGIANHVRYIRFVMTEVASTVAQCVRMPPRPAKI